MTIHVDALIEILARLCEDKDLKAAATESLKGGLLTGISAAIGGLLLGPAGLAIGGALGGLGAAISAQDFKPAAVIIREMSPSQKQKLLNSFRATFRNFGIDDVVTLGMMLTGNSSFQNLVLRDLTNFFQREMNMRIQGRT